MLGMMLVPVGESSAGAAGAKGRSGAMLERLLVGATRWLLRHRALVLLAWVTGSPFLLDVAIVYAILSFAAVLLVARYLERSL